MNYKVELSAQAERDLDDIYLWTKVKWSRNQATAYRRLLSEAIRSLKKNPKRCLIQPEFEALDWPVRQLLAGHGQHKHRILFTIVKKTVFVLHVRHTARDI